jgi:flavin-dependent dehydrogenase
VAALLAQKGIDVVLFEKERFPRFHIGESLMPETWWVFEKLGVLEKLKATESPRKHSVQFISESGKPSRPFYFFEAREGDSAVTWQVDRAEFDDLLLAHARESGAEVQQGVCVRRVIFEGNRAAGVVVEDGAGGEREVRSQVIVDATGLGALLARQLKLIVKDPKLSKAAIFRHFEGGRRDAGIDEGATLVIHTRGNRGWFWYIPLSHDRVSVGVVGEPADLLKGRGAPEEVLAGEIETHPTVRERLSAARAAGPVHVISDFSYRARRCAGEGWVLVGDAFGFIDPIYSTGVLLALKSGEMAAEAVAEGLAAGDLSARQLGKHQQVFTEGSEALRKLVYAFYTPNFSFANFVGQHPEHRGRLIQLLMGNVFRKDVLEIFDDLKEWCQLPEDFPIDLLEGPG